MFVWGVLKRGIPESVRFCIGDLPMYIFLCRLIPKLKLLFSFENIEFTPYSIIYGQIEDAFQKFPFRN